MKKLVVAVVVLVVLLLVAPFATGRLAEKRMNAGLDKMVEMAPYLKISDRKWTGGWFKSEQVVTITLADGLGGEMVKTITEAMAKAEKADGDAAMDAEGTEQPPSADDEPVEAEAQGDAAETPAEAAPEAPADVPADVPAMIAKSLSITLRNEVLHGPVLGFSGLGLARVDTHLDLPADVLKKIEEVFGSEPALEMSTRVGFFGGGTTTLKSEGRKLKFDKDDADVSYETFKLKVGASRNYDSYDFDGRLPSLTVKEKGKTSEFKLTDLTLKGDGDRVMGDLYDGEFVFNIKGIEFKGEGANEAVQIEDAHYVVETRTKDDFVNLSAKFGTGAVKAAQIKEQGIEIKEIHYNFSVQHLHAPTVAKLFEEMRGVYGAPLAGADDMEAALFAPMKEHAAELLKHDPAFGIDRIGLVTPDGEIVAKGLIKLVGTTPEDFSGAGGMALIGKLDADITIEASQKVLEKFPNGATMAGGAVDAGYAKRDGDKLVCHIVFKAGELTINGKPQAIPGLGGPPPGAMEEGAMEEGGEGEEAGEAEPQE